MSFSVHNQHTCIFTRIPEQCIKDRGKFSEDELRAITSQDYDWKRNLSIADQRTIAALYNLGKAIVFMCCFSSSGTHVLVLHVYGILTFEVTACICLNKYSTTLIIQTPGQKPKKGEFGSGE